MTDRPIIVRALACCALTVRPGCATPGRRLNQARSYREELHETGRTAPGMGWADVLRLTVYAVDLDAVLAAWDVLAERLAAAGATPPMTLLGVARLAIPGMAVELEVTAGR